MTADDAPIPSLGLILLVEDNQRVSEEISRVLQQAGWRVACASGCTPCVTRDTSGTSLANTTPDRPPLSTRSAIWCVPARPLDRPPNR